MNQINKYLNHITWLLNALKEHNKILNQDLKYKMNDKVFINNKNFQKYFYFFSIYLKLANNIEKGYQLIITSNKVNRTSIYTLKNTYLIRCAIQFKNAGNYLKSARQEIFSKNSLSLIFSEMKNIASLLMQLESDMNFLIINLY